MAGLVADFYAPQQGPAYACLASMGFSGIARYLVEQPAADPRALTRAEVVAAHAAGLAIHCVFEMNPTYAAYFTFQRGQKDARSAMFHLRALEAPHGTVVYFTADAPPSVIPPDALDPYFNGLEDVLQNEDDGLIVPGIYGFEAHIEHARALYPNVGKHLWQTYGTPRGPLDLWEHEQRVECGVQVDINDCTVNGWGEGMADEQTIREWAKQEARAVLAKEYGPALEAELQQRFADNTVTDIASAIAGAVKAVGQRLTG